MSGSAGIITLQVGGYANYVGAHYWNLQDETLGHLSSPEWGPAAQEVLAGKIYTHGQDPRPRLVIADFKGCQGGVRVQAEEGGMIVPEAASLPTWHGGVSVLRRDAVPQSKFYSLLADEADDDEAHGSDESDEERMDAAADRGGQDDEEDSGNGAMAQAAKALDSDSGPAFFTDFLKILLHPRSVVEVPDLWHRANTLSGYGDLLDMDSERIQVVDAVSDSIRRFAEECDIVEGVQCLTEDRGLWGGLTASLAEALADDYPKQPILLFSTRPARAPEPDSEVAALRDMRDALNTALAMGHLSQSCSLYVPIEVAGRGGKGSALQYDALNRFHSSALQAAAIDTSTLCYRLLAEQTQPTAACAGPPSQGASSMATLAQLLSCPAANFAALATALPAVDAIPDEVPAGARDSRLSARERRLKGLVDAPPAPCTVAYAGLEWLTGDMTPGRGILAESVTLRGTRCGSANLPCSVALTRLQASLQHEGIRAVRHLCAVAMPLAVPLPFPSIFHHGLTKRGDRTAFTQAVKQTQHAAPGSAGLASIGEDATTDKGAGAVGTSAAVVQSPPARCAPSTCAALTRLAATTAFEGALKASAASLQQGWHNHNSRDSLRKWGYGHEDVLGLREHLLDSMRRYQQFDSDEGSDMEDA